MVVLPMGWCPVQDRSWATGGNGVIHRAVRSELLGLGWLGWGLLVGVAEEFVDCHAEFSGCLFDGNRGLGVLEAVAGY
jgi:hypothetical protein